MDRDLTMHCLFAFLMALLSAVSLCSCAKSCGNPGALENGVVRSASFTYKSVVRYTCNRGYTLIGPSSRRCLENQMWQGSSPRCEVKPKDCTNIPRIQNAARPPNKVYHGMTLKYQCNAGYALSSQSVQKCQDGVLTGNRPSCIQDQDSGYIGCYVQMGYVRIIVDVVSITSCKKECRKRQRKFAGLKSGGTCYCGNVYKTKLQEKYCDMKCKFDQSSYCGGYYLFSVYKTGYLTDCTNVPRIRNAKMPPSSVRNGDYLQYQCNAGYVLSSQSVQKCHYGVLTGNRPSCIQDYSACGEGGVRSRGRILGGETADSTDGTQWPWQVAIYRNLDFVCGGSLIRDNVVLTAAHCLVNKARNRLLDTPNSYRVIVGQLRIRRGSLRHLDIIDWLLATGREVKEIFRHQSYNMASSDYQNDIALFQLREPVEWSSTVRPVCLPSASQYAENGLHGYVSGWGYTSEDSAVPESLNYVFLGINSNKTCDLDSGREKLMFCAGKADGQKDACKGDSGGPFVVKLPDTVDGTKSSFTVVGIVSHGPPCGKTGKYGFYTRVGHYVNWIKETISKMK